MRRPAESARVAVRERRRAEHLDVARFKQLRKPELIDAIRTAQNPLEKTA